jgi:cation diffusion facilitator family transporter
MAMNEKQWVALGSVLAGIFLTLFKLGVGLATNSLGILAEAAHSGLDLLAAGVTFLAVKISAKPADKTHHFGHGKVEGFSAFIEVILLLITCGWIIYEAVQRLTGKVSHVEVTVFSFLVMGVSVVVDIIISRLLYQAARKYKSQALEADGLHYASDIWSSAVVFVGLVGFKFFNYPLADPIAALVVSVLVIAVSIRLAIRTIHVLLDAAPAGVREKLEEALSQFSGIENLKSLRVRHSGTGTFVDMRLILDSGLSFVEAHQTARAVERKISEIIPGADALVHVNPSNKPSVKTIANIMEEHQELFSGYHDLDIVHHQDSYLVKMHLMMARDSKVEEAHEVCAHLEQDIKAMVPGATVNIHIEPISQVK